MTIIWIFMANFMLLQSIYCALRSRCIHMVLMEGEKISHCR